MARTPANVQPGQISERIIAAALQLFTQRGYFSTSVPDMARTAQVSVGSIYHHFKDKEDVARALFVGLMEGLQEALAKIAHDNATAHDRCRAVMAMLFELTESNRDAMDFMLYAKHRDFLPSERPVCSSKPFETMRAFVQDGMENGEIRNMDVMVATSCLFGGAIRLITARLDGVLAEPLPDRLDAVWDCAWRGVAA
ncbi:MAG: TetR/AcrR family transcriptional regulator [Thiobacillus sp.]|jgi:TetR/AcrR family transcriptional regulator, repressor of fatR-cypB operon|nr:TetR/AcrR family transcriptional regulator [Thiobacillus sp.]